MKEELKVVSVTQNGKNIPFKIDGNRVSFSADERNGVITVAYETINSEPSDNSVEHEHIYKNRYEAMKEHLKSQVETIVQLRADNKTLRELLKELPVRTSE